MNYKKILLLVIAIGAFLGYVMYERFFANGEQPVVENKQRVMQSTQSQNQNQGSQQSGGYKDGEYNGNVADAFYGSLQVKVIINGGKITDIQFLQYPNHMGHTMEVSSQSLPQLKSEAIQAQSAEVDIVSGATQTSQAFMQSLQSALLKAS